MGHFRVCGGSLWDEEHFTVKLLPHVRCLLVLIVVESEAEMLLFLTCRDPAASSGRAGEAPNVTVTGKNI